MGKDLDYHEQNNIHMFTWKSVNRRAVDLWMTWLTHIMIRDGSIGYMLLDFSEISLPPVRYMSMQVRRWLTQHPPPKRKSVVAVVYPMGNMPFLIVARSYITTLSRGRPVSVQIFSADEKLTAYQWLCDHMDNNVASG